jgi:ribosomal protein L29
MKTIKLEKKSETELKKILLEQRDQLRSLRFSLAIGKVKNAKEIGFVKKEIARILTLLQVLKNKKPETKEA